MTPTKISVALCTYNGDKFILQQLESIINQDLVVDEIIICDDGSSDNTLDMIRRIQAETSIPIHVSTNESSLGVYGNFHKAISLCSGDITFLSDQDDIWEPHKVKTTVDWFRNNPDKDVAFTNASFIDVKDDVYAGNMDLFMALGFNAGARIFFKMGFALELFFKNNRGVGATMAINKTAKERFLAKPKSSNILHDEAICLSAIENGSLGYLTAKLIRYRIHEGQTCGLKNCINVPFPTWNALSPLCGNIESLSSYTSACCIRRGRFMDERNYAFSSEGLATKYWRTLRYSSYSNHYGKWALLLYTRDALSYALRRTLFR